MKKTTLLLLFLFLSIDLYGFGVEFNLEKKLNIQSEITKTYLVKGSIHPQIVLIKNHEIDTFSMSKINNQDYYSASWMGINGYYYQFFPASDKDFELKINSLDSIGQKSIVDIKVFNLSNSNVNLVAAFKNHSHASNLRYQHYIGGVDKKEKAAELFNLAKIEFKKSNLDFFTALSSYELAITYSELNNHIFAVYELEIANHYWNDKDFIFQNIQSINIKGLSLWKLHKLEEALEIFKEAKIGFEQLNDKIFTAQTVNNIGLIHLEKNQIQKAQGSFLNALSIADISFQDTNNSLTLNITHKNTKSFRPVLSLINNLAMTHELMGNAVIAEKMWHLQLNLTKHLTDKNLYAQALNNAATLYTSKSDYSKAKQLLEESITIFEGLDNRLWLALSRFNLGQIYLELGMFSLADIQFQIANNLNKENNNPKNLINSQLKLIEVYKQQNKYRKSLALSEKTLILAKKIKLNKAIGEVHLNNFQIALINNDYFEANKQIELAKNVLWDNQIKRLSSRVKVNSAKLLILQNKPNQAINLLMIEIETLNQIWDTKQLNQANNLLTQAYLMKHDYQKAIVTIKKELANLNFYINTSTNSKIRLGLSKMLKESLSLYAIINSKLLKSELGFIKLNQMLSKLEKINIMNNTSFSIDSVDSMLLKINNKSDALENNKLSYNDRKQIQNEIIKIKAKLDFSYSTTPQSDKVNISFKKIQDQLDAKSLVVQYSIGEAGGIGWWISKDKVESHVIPNKKELSRLVKLAHEEFIQTVHSYKNIEKLSSVLLNPLTRFNNSNIIHFVLDEPLNLVPFNALFDPRSQQMQVLAENTSIKRLSSIQSVTNLSYNQSSNHKNLSALIIADPVTSANDDRLSINVSDEGSQPFSRLIGTKSEAENIGKLINTKTLQGFDASKKNLFNSQFEEKNILHFATHAFFHPEISGLSSIVLSQYNKDGKSNNSSYLRALEISSLNINSELVVLSGCETGVNKYDNSLGLGGLTDSFMQAGAKNLIASLWKVNDRITEKMMTEFYRGYANGLSIETALSQAQKLIRETRRTKHPKYWAGWFLLTN